MTGDDEDDVVALESQQLAQDNTQGEGLTVEGTQGDLYTA